MMSFTPEDLSIDLLKRAAGSNAGGGIATVANPLATHNTGNLLKGLMGTLGATGNPYLAALSIGLPLVGGLWDSFIESPRERLEKEILQARRERLGELRRQAKGHFTPAERQDIHRANEPVLNRVAANIAQRGLDTSGAALEVLAQAEQAPFIEARQQARVQLDDYELKTFDLSRQLMEEDDGFLGDIQGITQYLFQLGDRKQMDTDLMGLDKALTTIQDLLAKLKELTPEAL
jgi:hypothetical protein